jgi:hypothetical protein
LRQELGLTLSRDLSCNWHDLLYPVADGVEPFKSDPPPGLLIGARRDAERQFVDDVAGHARMFDDGTGRGA